MGGQLFKGSAIFAEELSPALPLASHLYQILHLNTTTLYFNFQLYDFLRDDEAMVPWKGLVTRQGRCHPGFSPTIQ